jgi:hypothetical protein
MKLETSGCSVTWLIRRPRPSRWDGHAEPLESDSTAALGRTSSRASPALAPSRSPPLLRGEGSSERQIPRRPAQDGPVSRCSRNRRGRIPGVCWYHGTAIESARWGPSLIQRARGRTKESESVFSVLGCISTTRVTPSGTRRVRLRAALTNTVQELDPDGKDPAFRRARAWSTSPASPHRPRPRRRARFAALVIGHSQGGLLTEAHRDRQT